LINHNYFVLKRDRRLHAIIVPYLLLNEMTFVFLCFMLFIYC